jgi:hypothetical protein
MITQEYLHEYFHYDKTTGQFLRKKKTGNSTKQGELVGSNKGNGYIVLCLKSRLYLAHRMAWLYVYGAMPTSNIDHINGNRADNRISNLRLATQSQNIANSLISKANKSGCKGVSWRKDIKKWRASIMVNYKQIALGCYDSKDEAYDAYISAAIKHFEGFARV